MAYAAQEFSAVSERVSPFPLLERPFKVDQGYRGAIQSAVPMASKAELQCVKTNFGTSDFIPLEGRWIVERTFSWMENYRRLTRNYDRYLKTAQAMFVAACVFFMIRYFR